MTQVDRRAKGDHRLTRRGAALRAVAYPTLSVDGRSLERSTPSSSRVTSSSKRLANSPIASLTSELDRPLDSLTISLVLGVVSLPNSRAPNAKRLDIVGAGPEGPRLKTLTQALALADRVRFHGEYPDEDLPRRMAEADFLVLPSVAVEEMFGLVVLEAMAAGRPVITTAVPTGVREVNAPGETGLEVPVHDVRSLAEALEQMAHDPYLREKMGDAGKARVEKYFTRQLMAERHVALYERVVAYQHSPEVAGA